MIVKQQSSSWALCPANAMGNVIQLLMKKNPLLLPQYIDLSELILQFQGLHWLLLKIWQAH